MDIVFTSHYSIVFLIKMLLDCLIKFLSDNLVVRSRHMETIKGILSNFKTIFFLNFQVRFNGKGGCALVKEGFVETIVDPSSSHGSIWTLKVGSSNRHVTVSEALLRLICTRKIWSSVQIFEVMKRPRSAVKEPYCSINLEVVLSLV